MNNSKETFDMEKLNRPSSYEEAKLKIESIKTEQGIKFDGGKIRYDLYPVKAYEGCAKVLTFGANKYAPNNWKLVSDPVNRYYSAMIRHLNAQRLWTEQGNKGLALDDETGLPHLDHAQCCLVFMRELS